VAESYRVGVFACPCSRHKDSGIQLHTDQIARNLVAQVAKGVVRTTTDIR